MLQKSVLATLAYYQTLDYPMTGFEIWKHLLTPDDTQVTPAVEMAAVLSSLDALRQAGRVQCVRGFWILPGYEACVARRIRREKQTVEKIKRAVRLIRWCSWLPYVRMIALTGSLSLKQSERDSDWDFLVVLKGGAIWTGRFLMTSWLTLLGQRRHGNKIPDRACLNCYLTDTHLEVPLRDVFSSHEYRFLYPVIGLETFRAFELANRWIARYRPHFLPTLVAPWFLRRSGRVTSWLQRMLEYSLPLQWIEAPLARWQQRLIQHNPKTHLPGSYISATDAALIFLPEPKGPQIFELFKKKLSEV